MASRKAVEDGILAVDDVENEVCGVVVKNWLVKRERVEGTEGLIYLPTRRPAVEMDCLSNKLAISCHAAAIKIHARNCQSGICISHYLSPSSESRLHGDVFPSNWRIRGKGKEKGLAMVGR
jgi:hypothetical protein